MAKKITMCKKKELTYEELYRRYLLKCEANNLSK